MPKPISRKEPIRRLRLLGFDGSLTVSIPHPHVGDIDWSLTKHLLLRTGIDYAEWDKLGG